MSALSGLEIEDLTLWRGERMLFRNLAFAVRAGEVLALEGPNGSGKTSLLRAIAGFLEPQAGIIRMRTDDGQTFDSGDARAENVGWLGHLDGLKPQMTAAEVLGFFTRYYRSSQATDAALTAVGLDRLRDLPVQYLSAGQKRRLALARLSLCARPLWLLDEPLAALDARGKVLAAALIADHCRQGGIAVAATHEALGVDCAHLKLGNGA